MSLSARDQQVLDRIEAAIADSEPGLVCLLATFGRLTAGEELPAREQISADRPGMSRSWFRLGRPRRAHGPSGRPGWPMAWSLLWLAASIALAIAAMTVRNDDSAGACGAGVLVCGLQAPAHDVPPAAPATPSGQPLGTSR